MLNIEFWYIKFKSCQLAKETCLKGKELSFSGGIKSSQFTCTSLSLGGDGFLFKAANWTVSITEYLILSFPGLVQQTEMSGDYLVAGSFVIADYVVFALTLVVSAAVGFYFAWASRGQQSSRDFLTAGRKLTALPVSMSMTASYMSSITVLSNPAEVKLIQCLRLMFKCRNTQTKIQRDYFWQVIKCSYLKLKQQTSWKTLRNLF